MPERKSSKPHIFTAWWSVLFIGITSGLGHGFNTYGISVFFKNIASEMQLSRAATSWAPGIGRLEGGITSPLVGWLSDKFGPRWVVITGILIAGTGLILMNYITQVWQYFVVWGLLIGFGLNIGLTVACDKMINDWFIRRRGLAQGIKFGLISILGIIIIQIITPPRRVARLALHLPYLGLYRTRYHTLCLFPDKTPAPGILRSSSGRSRGRL